MQAVRSKNNKAEGLLSRRLWAMGFRYRKYRWDLPGHPDIVFSTQKVVVFVDGDFWHARIYLTKGIAGLRRSLRTERAAWWVEKLRATAVRDRRVTRHLREMGFVVVRVWERDVLHDPDSVAARVARIIRNRAGPSLT